MIVILSDDLLAFVVRWLGGDLLNLAATARRFLPLRREWVRKKWWCTHQVTHFGPELRSAVEFVEIDRTEHLIEPLVELPAEWLDIRPPMWTHADTIAYQKSYAEGVWCATAKFLTFGPKVVDPLFMFPLPVGLESLELSSAYSQPLTGVEWPETLRSLTSLKFGNWFNQSLAGIVWPETLRNFTIGRCFNQSFDAINWPVPISTLSLPTFNRPLTATRWPDRVVEIEFHWFNQPIAGVRWPTTLEKLSLGIEFNQSLDGTIWPDSLVELHLGRRFNRPLARVNWPRRLRKLRISNHFERPIEEVSWPDSLEEIEFGTNFNRSIDRVRWPARLRRIKFGARFNQRIDRTEWPEGLEEIIFGFDFNQSLKRVSWPESLTRLSLGHLFKQPVDGWRASGRLSATRVSYLPPGLETLDLSFGYPKQIRYLPPSVTKVTGVVRRRLAVEYHGLLT